MVNLLFIVNPIIFIDEIFLQVFIVFIGVGVEFGTCVSSVF